MRGASNRCIGPGLSPGDDAAKATGIETVLPRSDFKAMVQGFAKEGRVIYTPFRAEVLGSVSSSDPDRLWAANKSDPWDGRRSREAGIPRDISRRPRRVGDPGSRSHPRRLRGIKSPREIACIREATRIAGLGIMEAMRDARPGLLEYELQADCEFVFKKYGALRGGLLRPDRHRPKHLLHPLPKNTAGLQDGDLVQFDYAPDYKNYSSDVTRVFPANGKFTPRQREYYTIYLRLYQALMTSHQSTRHPARHHQRRGGQDGRIMAAYNFTDRKSKPPGSSWRAIAQQAAPTASDIP